MKQLSVTNRLSEITTEAKIIYARMEKDYARWGELMIEAKELIPHGQWLNYLEQNFPMVGKRQANRYMELARDETKTLTQITHPTRSLNESHETLLPTVSKPRTVGDLYSEYEELPLYRSPPQTLLERTDGYLKVTAKVRDFRVYVMDLEFNEIDALPPEAKDHILSDVVKLQDFLETLKLRLKGKPQLRSVNND